MATEATIGGTGTERLFVGEDKIFKVEIIDVDGLPVNISGWGLAFVLKKTDDSATAALTLTGSVTGVFNAVRATNTQRATFTATDTQTALLSAKTYRYSVKRTDDGSETVVAFGACIVEKTTQT